MAIFLLSHRLPWVPAAIKAGAKAGRSGKGSET